jgi:gamma-glutamyltranspeptidase / glutathione hydrolase
MRAAAEALAEGGNAYDAAVAAGFAASVAEPCLSSLGGGGFLLARAATGRTVLFDFFVATPGRGRAPGSRPSLTPVTVRFRSAEQVFHVGHASVAVPGCLAGYLHVHRRLGRLPLAEVVRPARELARDGVVLGAHQAAVARLLEPILSLEPAVRAMFVPEGHPLGDEELVANPRLASFLEAVGAGDVTGFDDPAIAATIVQGMEAGGGILTAEDLAAYAVVEREPLAVAGDGWRLLTNPPPSFGGRLIGRAMARLAAEGPAGPWNSGARLRQLAEVLADVARSHTAPGDDPFPGGDRPSTPADTRSGDPPDGSSGTPSGDRPRTTRGTTHVSIADAAGNLATMTTSNGSGSGLTLGTTGVLANNIMGETDLHPAGFHRTPAGRRVGSMMAPTVLLREGRPPVALGSGGSERIRSAMVQTMAHLVDDDATLTDAVAAPRIHVDAAGVVQVEPGLPEAALEELAAERPVNPWPVTDLYFGGVNAVDGDGDRAGDPRRGGRTTEVPRAASTDPPTG